MKKYLLFILLITSFASSTNSCSSVETVKEDKVTDRMEIGEAGDLSKSMELPVDEEPFSVICEYDTGKYDAYNWHVTEDKSIRMKLRTKGLPEGYEVYVDHVHADISLRSTYASTQGILQDSMDNASHSVPTNGFYIDDNTKYNRVFFY